MADRHRTLGRYAEAMDHVQFLERPPAKRAPLICAFRGWNDGGEAATIAIRYLQERWHGKVFAHLDPEEFFDFQVSRPTVKLEDGVSRVIEWPRGEFAAASVQGRDVVLFTCNEPNVRWRTFTQALIGVARELDTALLVTLGAFLTDVPHTRTVPVVGSAIDQETAGRLGLARSQYEGPTGIVGVIHDASIRAGLPSVSLWAAVPHYLPAAPNPKAALALIKRASALLELPVDTSSLQRAADGWEESVAKLIQESDELSEYVGKLEAAADQNLGQVRMEPVSGESIAAELERFLREQDQGGSPS
jgi:predicted ATP-grasp superfamily ATP-dependent carboligase